MPSSVDEAFRSAHPGGDLPPGLQRDEGARLDLEGLATVSRVDRLLTPGWLPPGYGLAEPYVSVGDGGALPNPQVWEGGYRVSFTDGEGLVILHVGDGRLPGEGPWRPLARRWRGSRLWTRETSDAVTVAARRRPEPVAVAVVGLPSAAAQRVLDGLRVLP